MRFSLALAVFFCKSGQESLVLGIDLVEILRTYFSQPQGNEPRSSSFLLSILFVMLLVVTVGSLLVMGVML